MEDKLWVALEEEVLDMNKVTSFLYDAKAGGVDIFAGTTRQWTNKEGEEKETVELSYECYPPMALKEMRALLQEAVERWPVVKACLIHRLGVVPVGEASVIIGVSTPHRVAAFEACRYLIDRLKIQVPIWKKEHYADGETEWVQGKARPEVRDETGDKG